MKDRLVAAFRFGNGIVGIISILAVFAWVPIRRRLGLSSHRSWRLPCRGWGKEFSFFVSDGSDIAVFLEVFLHEEYRVPVTFQNTPGAIIDLGANIGAAAVYFALTGGTDRPLYALEPGAIAFERLVRNTRAFGNIIPLRVAVAATSGPLSFYEDAASPMSSSVIERRPGVEKYLVPGLSLDDLCTAEGIESVALVKCDIEGGEFALFSQARSWLTAMHPIVLGEYHADLCGRPVEDFCALFPGFTTERTFLAPARFLVRCLPASLAEVSPSGSPLRDTSFYNDESGAYASHRYVARPHSYAQAFFSRRLALLLALLPSLGFRKGHTLAVLELGCADGVVASAIEHAYPHGDSGRYIAADIAPKMIERARHLHAGEQLSFVVRDALPSGPYDRVIETGVLSYIPAWEEEIRTVHQLLSSGGVWVVSVAGKGSLWGMRHDPALRFPHFLPYAVYEQAFREFFSIEVVSPVGLFVPLLWKVPVLARPLQTIAEHIFSPIVPNLFHEKLYVLRKKDR